MLLKRKRNSKAMILDLWSY